MAPNVLLIVLDTARRDAIEPYGAQAGTSPTIAQLARRGHALPHAYSTASWTLPSHVSIFTGLLPRQFGLCQPPGGSPQGAREPLERNRDRLLAEVLRRAGYVTQGWSTNLWASAHAGFDIGFDSLEYVASGREDRLNALLAGGIRAQLAWAREGLRSRSDDGAATIGSALTHAIDEWSGTPTFWFVNLSECHSPYLPPRPWNEFDPLDRVRAALEAKRYLNFESICLYAAGGLEIPVAAFERMRALYRSAIAYMDDWIAGVLEALERRGILDDTLVIVTSDHGENFGEGGLIAHGFSVDERLTAVPLVMAGPGAVESDEVFSLASLPRVIADAAGLDAHPWSVPSLPSGVAIAQYDPMAAADHPRVRTFASKFGLAEEGIDRICASFTSATDGATKLVVRDGAELVYDLAADPGETRPLERVNGHVDALRDALAQLEAGPAAEVGQAGGAGAAGGAGGAGGPRPRSSRRSSAR